MAKILFLMDDTTHIDKTELLKRICLQERKTFGACTVEISF